MLENPHGQRSLVGYSPWGHKGSDTTEHVQDLMLLSREDKDLGVASHAPPGSQASPRDKKTWHTLLPPMTTMIAGDDTVVVSSLELVACPASTCEAYK